MLAHEFSARMRRRIPLLHSALAGWHGLFLLAAVFNTTGAITPPTDAAGFFTNVANRLLRSELNLPLNHIQIFPTNQYSPALQRLLRVTANLFEATGTNYFPTVYRPQFAADSTNSPANFYIVGYEQVDGTDFMKQPWYTLDSLVDVLTNPPVSVLVSGSATNYLYDINVYDIPVIIGAKKGHPAFNKIAVETIVSVARKLFFVKDSASDRFPKVGGTNQMFIIGITNTFAIQAWNSYSQSYPIEGRQVMVWVSNGISSALQFDQVSASTNLGVVTARSINSGQWTGYQQNLGNNQFSFSVFYTNFPALPDSVLHPSRTPPFEPVNGPSTYDNEFTNFHGAISLLVSNRFNFFIVDATPGESPKLIDAVSLSDLTTSLDLAQELSNAVESASSRFVRGVWDFTGLGSINQGVNNQIIISLLQPATTQQEWADYAQEGVSNRLYTIDRLRSFLGFYPQTYTNFPATNICQAGFTPWTRIRHHKTWEVNDPMVHSTTNDLVLWTNATIALKATEFVNFYTAFTNFQLFTKNEAYRPWRYDESNPLATDVSIRDPQVMNSDDWDFPTNQTSLLSCIGQIHRGTPWQTIYLKAAVAPSNIWLYPNGPAKTLATHPTNDWRLVGLLASMFNTNPPSALLSINETNPAAWAAAMDGLTVVSNVADLPCCLIPVSIQISSNSPQAYAIAGALARVRASRSDQYFHNLGDILATPEFSIQSPWFSYEYPLGAWALDDFAYEALSRQLLPKLREDPVLQFNPASNQLILNWPAFPDQLFDLEASADLRQWDVLGTNISPGQPFDLSAIPGTNPAPRFFRARLSGRGRLVPASSLGRGRLAPAFLPRRKRAIPALKHVRTTT